jgi:hypothetical protein
MELRSDMGRCRLYPVRPGEVSTVKRAHRLYAKMPIRYLSNIPLLVIVVAALVLGSKRLHSRYKGRASSKARISPSDLISPAADSNLAKLEADTILSSLAASLLPAHLDSTIPEQPVHTSEAGRIIDDFKERPLDVKRWTMVRRGVLVGGSAAWLGVEISRAVLQKNWKGIAFPVSAVAASRRS